MNKYIVQIQPNDKCSPDKSSENREFAMLPLAKTYLAHLATKYQCTTKDNRTGMFWAMRFYGTKYSVELTIEAV